METLAPQEYGKGNVDKVGVLLQRSWLICMVFFFPFCILWMNAAPILKAMGQPEEIVRRSARFLQIFAVSIPLFTLTECIRRYFVVFNVVQPFAMIQVVTTLVHIALVWLSVSVFHGEFVTIAWAHVGSSATATLLALLYSRFLAPPETAVGWAGIDLKSSLEPRELIAFLKLGIPGIFSMSEWWFWESMAFIAGELGKTALAAHSVTYSLMPLTFMFPFSISIGLCTRLGVMMGRGGKKNVQTARTLATMSLAVGMLVVVSVCVLSVLIRRDFIGMYSKDRDVVSLVNMIWTPAALYIIPDGCLALLTGVVRGLGLQARLATVVMVVLWSFGLPTIYYIVFTAKVGLAGMWWSMGPLYVLLDSVVAITCSRLDWELVSQSMQLEENGVVSMPPYERVRQHTDACDDDGAEENEEEDIFDEDESAYGL